MTRRVRVFRWDALGLLSLNLIVWGLVGIGGCRHPIHPGAISVVDSNVYDTLLVAQAALDEARGVVQQNPSNANYRAAFNYAVAVYNQAEADWQLYHSTGDGTLQAKLQQEVSQVVASIADLRKALGAKVAKQGGAK